jgi:hypothetical protein
MEQRDLDAVIARCSLHLRALERYERIGQRARVGVDLALAALRAYGLSSNLADLGHARFVLDGMDEGSTALSASEQALHEALRYAVALADPTDVIPDERAVASLDAFLEDVRDADADVGENVVMRDLRLARAAMAAYGGSLR